MAYLGMLLKFLTELTKVIIGTLLNYEDRMVSL